MCYGQSNEIDATNDMARQVCDYYRHWTIGLAHFGASNWGHLRGDNYLAEVNYDANDNDADDKKEARHFS